MSQLLPEEQEFRSEALSLKMRDSEFKQLQETLENYQTVDRGPSKATSGLLPILRRYNSTWETTKTSDPLQLPGFVRFFPSMRALGTIRPLLSQPFFYRLNFIRQLSTVHLWQNLEAGHSRLAHSLGVVQCAEVFLDALTRRYPLDIDDWERRAVLIYAFIHDAFHGPMGHSLELMKTVFTPADNSAGKLDKIFLSGALADSESPLCRALNASLDGDRYKDSIIRYLRFFCARRTPPELEGRHFLKQIVDSQFDADRLDYIFRDAHHLGVSLQFSPHDVYDVIENITISSREVDAKTGLKRRHLAFSLEHEATISQVLDSRLTLYTEYYDNSTKITVDEMICHSLYYVLRDRGVLPLVLQEDESNLFIEQKKIISELSHLTDGDLWHFFYEAEGPLFAQVMIRDVLTNNYFREIASRCVVDDTLLGSGEQFDKAFEKVVSDAKKWAPAFEKELEKIKRRRAEKEEIRADLLIPTEENRLEAANKAAKAFKQDVALFHFIHNTWLGGFGTRVKVEKLFWKLMMDDQAMKKETERYYTDRFGKMDTSVLDDLMRFPLVHISIPPYVVTKAKESREYTKEDAHEPLILCDEKGNLKELKYQGKPSRNMLSVILSGPAAFAAEGLREKIAGRFDKMYLSQMWLDTRILNTLDI